MNGPYTLERCIEAADGEGFLDEPEGHKDALLRELWILRAKAAKADEIAAMLDLRNPRDDRFYLWRSDYASVEWGPWVQGAPGDKVEGA